MSECPNRCGGCYTLELDFPQIVFKNTFLAFGSRRPPKFGGLKEGILAKFKLCDRRISRILYPVNQSFERSFFWECKSAIA